MSLIAINKMKIKNYFRDFYDLHCHVESKTVGYAIGWFGAVYRIAAILSLAITVSKSEDDQNMFDTSLMVILGYCFISLALNFLSVVGINKENEYYMLPYLGVYGIEICVGIIFLIGGIIYFVKTDQALVLSYFIPISAIILGIYTYLWFCLIQLFKQFENTSADQKSLSSSEEFEFNFLCEWNCFKSDSLDIAT